MVLPALPGSYALCLLLPEPVRLQIGRLGTYNFPTGSYVYFGSAHGSGGLRARLGHHTRIASNPRWHLDYLRPYVVLSGGWYSLVDTVLECRWSKAALQISGASAPVRGFGAADCRQGCAAHLIHLPAVGMEELKALLEQTGNVRYLE